MRRSSRRNNAWSISGGFPPPPDAGGRGSPAISPAAESSAEPGWVSIDRSRLHALRPTNMNRPKALATLAIEAPGLDGDGDGEKFEAAAVTIKADVPIKTTSRSRRRPATRSDRQVASVCAAANKARPRYANDKARSITRSSGGHRLQPAT